MIYIWYSITFSKPYCTNTQQTCQQEWADFMTVEIFASKACFHFLCPSKLHEQGWWSIANQYIVCSWIYQLNYSSEKLLIRPRTVCFPVLLKKPLAYAHCIWPQILLCSHRVWSLLLIVYILTSAKAYNNNYQTENQTVTGSLAKILAARRVGSYWESLQAGNNAFANFQWKEQLCIYCFVVLKEFSSYYRLKTYMLHHCANKGGTSSWSTSQL